MANLGAWPIDCRLTGLAASAVAGNTRYADDLPLSGGADFERGIERFAARAAVILPEEGTWPDS